MRRSLFTDEHDLFRQSFRTFVDKEIAPHHLEWEAAGTVSRELFLAAGAHGFLGMAVPEQYGGGGVDDFRYNLVISEEIQRAGCRPAPAWASRCTTTSACRTSRVSPRTSRSNDGCLVSASGELITAIAMTEPGDRLGPRVDEDHGDP